MTTYTTGEDSKVILEFIRLLSETAPGENLVPAAAFDSLAIHGRVRFSLDTFPTLSGAAIFYNAETGRMDLFFKRNTIRLTEHPLSGMMGTGSENVRDEDDDTTFHNIASISVMSALTALYSLKDHELIGELITHILRDLISVFKRLNNTPVFSALEKLARGERITVVSSPDYRRIDVSADIEVNNYQYQNTSASVSGDMLTAVEENTLSVNYCGGKVEGRCSLRFAGSLLSRFPNGRLYDPGRHAAKIKKIKTHFNSLVASGGAMRDDNRIALRLDQKLVDLNYPDDSFSTIAGRACDGGGIYTPSGFPSQWSPIEFDSKLLDRISVPPSLVDYVSEIKDCRASEFIDVTGKSLSGNVICLSGRPGTGKTTTVKAISETMRSLTTTLSAPKELPKGQPVGQVVLDPHTFTREEPTITASSFDNMRGMADTKLSGTTDGIRVTFSNATNYGLVIVVNEADAILADREYGGNPEFVSSVLDHMDSFPGTIILTTNYYDRMDDAVKSRINKHFEFTNSTSGNEKLCRTLAGLNNITMSDKVVKVIGTIARTGRDVQHIMREVFQRMGEGNPTDEFILGVAKDYARNKRGSSRVTKTLNLPKRK